MEWLERRDALHRSNSFFQKAVKYRPTPSAHDMKTMGMAIATQAKMNLIERDGSTSELDKDSERWVQTVSPQDSRYKVSLEPPREGHKLHKQQTHMNVLRILENGKKVCIARKQQFAGTLGSVCQPFLGVQIKPPEIVKADDEMKDPLLQSLLDVNGLMLLLMCLAWSEETMSPVSNMSKKFIDAMRIAPGEAGSASEHNLSVSWNTDDVKQRLHHVPYFNFHNWAAEGTGSAAEGEDGAEVEHTEDRKSVV